MKKTKKLFTVLFSVVMLVSCMAIPAFAAETSTQDGLTAVIQTDKESYAVNEDIQITVTVTNNNSFKVKNVSIEGLLPDALTLKDGDLKSKTVDLQPGETLSISYVAVLEKEDTSIIDPATTEPITTEPATVETTEPESSTEPEGTTAEETTGETATTPDTTAAGTEATETTTDGGAILPLEPSTIEPTTIEPTSALTTQADTPDNPNTGSGSTIVKALLITVIAAAVVVTIVVITKKNNEKATKVISLVLCGAIVASSFATIGFIEVGAKENNTRSFTVDKTITVGGEVYTFSANINYDILKDTIKLESDPNDLSMDDIPKNVLFFIDLENTTDTYKVTLVNAKDNKKVIDMKDDGSNGDQKVRDGIYSATISVDCSEEKILEYYAVISNGSSFLTSRISLGDKLRFVERIQESHPRVSMRIGLLEQLEGVQ